jgi:uncharacterized protein YndB with AHSA1/START domain
MYCWKTSLLLDAPRDRVWETLTDFTKTHVWDPSVTQATLETEGAIGQGTRFRIRNGRNQKLLTVEEWGPPRLLRLYLSSGKTTGSLRYYLTNAENGKTQLEHSFELDPPFYLEPFVILANFKNNRSLKALKRQVEKKD